MTRFRTAVLATAVVVVGAGLAWRAAIRAELRTARQSLEDGRFETARQRYDALAARDVPAAVIENNAGAALYGLGRYADAAARFQRAATNPASSADAAKAIYNLGNALVRLDRLDEALEAYRQALRLDPADDDARYNFALVQARLAARAGPSASSAPERAPITLTRAQATALLDAVSTPATNLTLEEPPPGQRKPAIDR